MKFHRFTAASIALFALLGCATRLAHQQSPSARTATLSLTGVYPGPNAAVNERTVIEADLHYAIGDIKSGSYSAFAQVETTTPGVGTDGTFPLKLHAKLTKAEGDVRFSFPLSYVWNQPGVQHPLAVWFYINTEVDKKYSKILAKVGPVIYTE
jgi:hypothetical protein